MYVQIIDSYVFLIMLYANQKKARAVYSVTCYFYTQSGCKAVVKWIQVIVFFCFFYLVIVWCYSLQDDVFSYDKLLIPVNTGAHWTLAVVDFAEKEFRYYDSMLTDNEACLQRIRFMIGSASSTLNSLLLFLL